MQYNIKYYNMKQYNTKNTIQYNANNCNLRMVIVMRSNPNSFEDFFL